ncbi:MAG TPA: hypothetical protein VJX67_16445, partial [Blastocatellia bacterium]|nr:hypothetical protein [Blastocatellia bacterium]
MASSETFVTAPPTGSAAEDKSMEGQQILDKARGQLILYIVLSTLAIFAVGVAVYVAYSRDDDVCWPAVLLILPIALQFIGVWVLYLKIVRGKDGKVWTFYWFYLWGMIWCWWTCAFLLLFYTFYPSDPNGLMAWLLRWLPLIFICWLLGHVLLMTHVIMKPRSYTADLEPRPASDEGKHRLRPSETRMKDWLRSFETRMRDSVARVPHFGVLFFFSVFMAVAYVFGFAFAYHDKDRLATTKRPALFRAKNLAVEAPGNPQAGTVMQPGQDSGRELTDCIWPEYRFYYDSDENFPVTIKPAEDDRGTRYHVHLDEYPNSEKPEHWRVAKNTDSLSEVATQIGARLDEGK